MGFVLSVLYLVTYYLTPTAIFGPFAPFRIELILAVLVFLVSLPALLKSFLGKTPQTIAVIGLVQERAAFNPAAASFQHAAVLCRRCVCLLSGLPALQFQEKAPSAGSDAPVRLPVRNRARLL